MLITDPTFEHLYRLFPDSADEPTATVIAGEEVPPPYHGLLVHTEHMTVTVEAFYGSPVDVKVMACQRRGNEYSRKILLTTKPDGKVVQFGLVRIDLGVCPDAVRDAIVEGKTPLGRVLIEHDMLRRIEPIAYLRVRLGQTMADWFGVPNHSETFGRIGLIYTGNEPAVEVLEILSPI